jgi:perosamine synthetase
MENNLENFTIKIPTTLKDILKKINKNLKGLIFVVDSKNRLIGSISDGDIRRGVLDDVVKKKVDLKSEFINFKPFFLNYKTDTKIILSYLQNQKNKNKFKCIPLVDKNRVIIDVSTIENIRRYPISNLILGNTEFRNVLNVMKSGWISSSGSYVTQFEKEFSKYIGGGFSVSTSSGTTALELALKSYDIGINDEVIVPNFSFAASINSIINVGAKPVVADIDPTTWTIDLKELQKKITKKTKAIMPVHIYGQPCKIKEIVKIAKSNRLYVIEDAAEALGATYNKKKIGLDGDCSCFSFYANKIITTGEGGMVLFKRKNKIKIANLIKNHGMDKKKPYYHTRIGNNYRMTNIQAAIGLGQLEKINKFIKSRKKIFINYNNKFKNYNFLSFLPDNNWSTNSYWLYTVLIKKIGRSKRDLLIKRLIKCGIDTRPGFVAFSKMDIYKKFCEGSYKNSEYISENSISLPSSHINKSEQNYIASIFIKELQKIYKYYEV